MNVSGKTIEIPLLAKLNGKLDTSFHPSYLFWGYAWIVSTMLLQ